MLYAILCLFICSNFFIYSQRYKEKNTFQLIIGNDTKNTTEMCQFSSFHKCSISNACSYVIRFKSMSECKGIQNLKQLEISADMLVWEKLPKRPGTYKCFSTLANYFTVRKGDELFEFIQCVLKSTQISMVAAQKKISNFSSQIFED